MDAGLKKRAREILKTWKDIFDAAKYAIRSYNGETTLLSEEVLPFFLVAL